MALRRLEVAEQFPSRPFAQACFADGTAQEVIEAFHIPHPPSANPFQTRYSPGPRWEETAFTPVETPLGQPVTLSWSVIPDGTLIAATGSIGDAQAPSNFRSWLDGLFGNEATWRPILRSVFERWEQLTGLNFVEELADDGASFIDTPGAAGVRGDVRIGGKLIDGTGNVLAYNYYPQSGDMVFDTADANFNNNTNNARFFRNVMSHEHGHGMGLAHSCPITRTKLMEPFINTGFDGPTHDDIRGAHNFYGDIYEPNDLVPTSLGALASPITVGSVPAPAVNFGSTVSLANTADLDRYSFTVSGPTLLSATLSPVGFTYGADRQACSGFPGTCCVTVYDSSQQEAGLLLSVKSGDTVLVANAGVAGSAVQSSVYLPSAGTYEISVNTLQTVEQVQLYTLALETSAAAITLAPTLAPEVVPPAQAVDVLATVTRGSQALQAGSVTLWTRASAGDAFVSQSMTQTGGGTSAGFFEGSLPGANCGQTIEYFFTASGTGSTLVRQPAVGAFVSRVGSFSTVLSDNFETDTGWTVSTTATSGEWIREIPVGTAAQPNIDTTPDDGANPGSICWVTGNASPGAGDGTADVDGGETTLTSPFYALTGANRPRLTFSLWYSNGAGAGAYNDTAQVEIRTTPSGAWLNALTLGPGGILDTSVQPGWQTRTIDLANLGFVAPLGVQLRYRVSDLGTGSLLEAGLDDFAILSLTCTQPTCDSIDFNGDGLFPDDSDLIDFLSVLAGGPCSSGTCSDIDFNNDGLFPDDSDLVAFLRVLAGGDC